MIENARRFVRQKLGSVGIVIALSSLAILSALPLATGQKAGFTATLAVFIMTSGIVARDAASGALQMILCRPILRVEYLVGRFLGAAALFAGFVAASFAIALLLDRVVRLANWSPFSPSFPWKSALFAAAADWTGGVLVIATLLFFSTFLRGLGDVLAFVVAALVIGFLPQIGRALHQPGWARAGALLADNLSPTLPLEALGRGRVLAAPAAAYLLALAAYVLAAALIFRRREFSYGTD